MAGKIKGITVEIGGETTKLESALKEVENKGAAASSELKEINRALKFDPSNVTLLAQKTDVLSESVSAVKNKLQILKDAQNEVEKKFAEGNLNADEYREFSREIERTENYLNHLDKQLHETSGATKEAKDPVEKLKNAYSEVKDKIESFIDAHPKLENALNYTEKGCKIAANGAKELAKGGFEILKGSAAAAAAGVTAVTAATVKFTSEAVESYSELEQNLGGSEAVFGKYASEIQKSGEDAYKTMGTTQSEYLATANKMGALFQGSGVEQQKSLELTQKAMQRSADMASVMGIETSAALEAVTGAAKGNYTMMDNLGVKMSATTLEAYSVAKGFKTAFKDMSEAQKAEVAMQYFFENTEQYAGNFEREATETISGSFALISASKDSLIAGLGNANADVVNLSDNLIDAVTASITNVVPVVENVGTALPEVIESLADGFAGAADELLPTISETIPDMVTDITVTLFDCTPQLVSAGFSLFEGMISGFADNSDLIMESAQDMIDTLKLDLESDSNADKLIHASVTILSSFVRFVGNNSDLLIDGAVMMIDSIVDSLDDPQNSENLIHGAIDIIFTLLDAIIDNAPILIDAAVELAAVLVNELLTYDWWGVAKKIIFSLKDSLVNIFKNGQDGYDDTPGHAGGMGYVPYNGYRSVLHQGEAVLTAAQAAEYRESQKSRNDYDKISSRLDSIERKVDRDISVNSPVNISYSGSGGALVRNLNKEITRENRRKTAFKTKRSEA